MNFTLLVSILNAIGWICYYVFSGGINEPTETSAVRIWTILGFIICSAIAGLVSIHCTHVFNSMSLKPSEKSAIVLKRSTLKRLETITITLPM